MYPCREDLRVCIPDRENPQSADIRSSHGTEDHQSGRRFGGVASLKVPMIISICLPAELSSTTSPSDVTRAVGYEPTVLRTPEVDQAQRGHSSGLSLVRRNSFERDIPWDSNPSILSFHPFCPQQSLPNHGYRSHSWETRSYRSSSLR